MTFKEVALKHLRETYDLPDYSFATDDPLSLRAEYIHAINGRCELAYMFDDDVPKVLLTGVSGFEDVLTDPQQMAQILMSQALLDMSGDPYKNLPTLIPPFSTEIFKDKDCMFSVNLGDLIEETDDEDWGKDLDDNYNLWLAGRKEFLADQLYSAMVSLEEQNPGITIAFLKSCFVTSFYNITLDDDGTFDVDDLWDIFGWTIDLWEDWATPETSKKSATKAEIRVLKAKDIPIDEAFKKADGWDDYNEQFFPSTE